MPTRTRIAALTTALALLLTGCSGAGGAESDSQTQAGPTSSDAAPSPTPITPADYAEEAATIVGDFTEDELAGSLIIGTWAGTEAQTAVDMVNKSSLGGVIVMADNLTETPTPKEVTALTKAVAGARTKGQPVSIGIDQEAGQSPG